MSYYSGTWDQLIEIILSNWDSRRPGYREEVVLVDIPEVFLDSFYSGITVLTDGDLLLGKYAPREGALKGEEPRISYYKEMRPVVAQGGYIVLYQSSILEESTLDINDPHNWEIVSINCTPTAEVAPINPWTLMHNHFGSSGGTDTKMSDSAFTKDLQEAFAYWKNKAMCNPSS